MCTPWRHREDYSYSHSEYRLCMGKTGQIYSSVSCTTGKRLRCLLSRRLGGSLSRFGCYGEENLIPVLEIEPRFIGCPTCNLDTIPTEVSRANLAWIPRIFQVRMRERRENSQDSMFLAVRVHPRLPKYEQQCHTRDTLYHAKDDINWAGVLWFYTISHNCSWNYSRIISTKSPPFCVTT